MISVVIITKNEERNIRECLDSVKWCKEVIVIDSQSTDKTASICQEFSNVKVEVTHWRGDASQRNYGISQVTGRWVLNVDADERVTPELKKELLELEANENVPYDAYLISFKHHIADKWMNYGDYFPDYKIRLFRSHLRFEKEVHAKVNAKKVGKFYGLLIHKTYINLEDAIQKLNRYTSLEAAILKNGFKFKWYTWFRPFYYFFKVYFLQQGFRNGTIGLASCFLRFLNNFSLYFKIWELKQRDKSLGKDLE